MAVRRRLERGFGGGQSLESDGSIGLEQLGHDEVDWAFKEACFVVDEIGEAVWIDSSVDLLDNGSFDEVTYLERLHGLGVDFFGYRSQSGWRLSHSSLEALVGPVE